MAKYVIQITGSLVKNVLVDADDEFEAEELAEDALEEGKITFSRDDIDDDDVEFFTQTLEDAEDNDGISERDCERI